MRPFIPKIQEKRSRPHQRNETENLRCKAETEAQRENNRTQMKAISISIIFCKKNKYLKVTSKLKKNKIE